MYTHAHKSTLYALAGTQASTMRIGSNVTLLGGITIYFPYFGSLKSYLQVQSSSYIIIIIIKLYDGSSNACEWLCFSLVFIYGIRFQYSHMGRKSQKYLVYLFVYFVNGILPLVLLFHFHSGFWPTSIFDTHNIEYSKCSIRSKKPSKSV